MAPAVVLVVGEQCGGDSCDDYMEAHMLLLGSAHHGLQAAAHVTEVRLDYVVHDGPSPLHSSALCTNGGELVNAQLHRYVLNVHKQQDIVLAAQYATTANNLSCHRCISYSSSIVSATGSSGVRYSRLESDMIGVLLTI